MLRRSSSLLLALVLALAACGGDGTADDGVTTTSESASTTTAETTTTTTAATPPTVPSSTGLRADIEESRLFATRRQLSLQMSVEGPTGVGITTIRLASPLFDLIEATPKPITIQAGQGPVAMPLSYGAARCTEPGPEPSMVEVTVNGVVEPLPLGPSGVRVLRMAHDEECAVRRVTDSVEIVFGDEWEPAGERTLSGQIVLRARQPGVEASLEDVRGSIIYTIPFEGDPPLASIDGDAAEDAVDVPLVVSRCDVHALIESARKYVFTAYVSVDGEEPQAVEFAPTGPAQEAFRQLLEDCVN